jgi:hypothetical protein
MSHRGWDGSGISEMRNAYKILVGKPMNRWQDIKMDLKETGCQLD